ncbi:hypothetical protein XBLMG947_0839 [Xanthomonas bromi]|uniref:Uncharacterized protein n=1 Tax=Xanthomonas bromi TaxID=56449 RepID=A0A1C3NI56_9XANT|nr:hypothetical protein XBLMG947_0839 [Xanthomonas bromi]
MTWAAKHGAGSRQVCDEGAQEPQWLRCLPSRSTGRASQPAVQSCS